MRPQGFNGFNGGPGFNAGGSLEDLGWDDMGPEDEFHAHTAPIGLTPAPRGHHEHEAHEQEPFEQAELPEEALAHPVEQVQSPVVAPPPVVEQQRALRESFAEGEVVELPRRRAAPANLKAKAAFTLRLDPERHLKLRLASAVTRLSAQQLVTGALDDFLNSLPELEAMADRVPAEAGQRRS
jgi:predicted HicB family RNase H-like nuclease